MRILYVADGRSPIALNWIRYFLEKGDEVYLASTFQCRPRLDLKGLDIVPVAFSGAGGSSPSNASRRASSWTMRLRTAIRHHLGPLTINNAAQKLRKVIHRTKPDLIHAMRIPYEGMLAAEAYSDIPLLVSVWGNDFTLHAPASPLMHHYTHYTLKIADALHADCQRDIRLAQEWGFSMKRPMLVTPGNGGVRLDVFHPPHTPVQAPIAINPRGFRTYVRNDVFFKAIPVVLKQVPQARFLCAAMEGEIQALNWINKFGIGESVELLAPVTHDRMGELYRRASVLVSPSVHDGTPNTLLEGIASGCFPVAGDLESIREWIEPGENGLLFEATNPESLANAVIEAFKGSDLRERAAGLNEKHIRERGEYFTCMEQARSFYERILSA
jgi:glycosyltransferase involved in cell wall biosynthesis